jgi:hypothetical protein
MPIAIKSQALTDMSPPTPVLLQECRRLPPVLAITKNVDWICGADGLDLWC